MNETKDLVGQYKGKIESLKVLITSSNSNVPVHEFLNENYENIEPSGNSTGTGGSSLDLKQDISDSARTLEETIKKSTTLNHATTAKIVKCIKGGQSNLN